MYILWFHVGQKKCFTQSCQHLFQLTNGHGCGGWFCLLREVVGSSFGGSREGLWTEPFAGGGGSLFDFCPCMANNPMMTPGLCGFQCGDAAAAADPKWCQGAANSSRSRSQGCSHLPIASPGETRVAQNGYEFGTLGNVLGVSMASRWDMRIIQKVLVLSGFALDSRCLSLLTFIGQFWHFHAQTIRATLPPSFLDSSHNKSTV